MRAQGTVCLRSSANCLREAHSTIAKEKPITLVHDPIRGGASLEAIMDECPPELRGPIFDERNVIVWHRIKDFQLVSLKLVAEQLLLGCPSFFDNDSLQLHVPGELTARPLACALRRDGPERGQPRRRLHERSNFGQ